MDYTNADRLLDMAISLAAFAALMVPLYLVDMRQRHNQVEAQRRTIARELRRAGQR